jgi:PAS domain S-box-containing protein
MAGYATDLGHLLLDALPGLVWTALPDGQAEYIGKQWLDYTGLTFEQAIGAGWIDAVHPDDSSRLLSTWGAIIASGELGELEARLRRHDGVYRWFLFRGCPMTDPSGEVTRWCGINLDIDDRVRAEAGSKLVEDALRASQAKLLETYAHLSEAQRLSRTGSFTWDVERDEHNWSPEARRMWEFDPDCKISLPMILATVHPDDIPLAEEVIGGAVQQDHFEVVLRIITKSGLLKHVHVVGRRVAEIPDRPVFLGAIQDITERKAAGEALDRARAELAHVARAMTLSALTASIAHEVNQPLAGIITNANTGLRMLSADPPNLDGVQATIQRTLRDGNRACEVIARLRAMFARRAPGLESVDLNGAAREVMALSAGELQQRRVMLSTGFAEDLPPLLGDRVQLQQVILNLVLNAADAMSDIDDRPRNLRISTEREEPNDIKLSVQDSGVGLETEAIEQLFHAFYTTKPDGMGIGLAISRTIIENHDGRLWAAPNEDGPGATFSFSIPNRSELAVRQEPG